MRVYIYLLIVLFFSTLGVRSITRDDRQEVQYAQVVEYNGYLEHLPVRLGYTGTPAFPQQLYASSGEFSQEEGDIPNLMSSIYKPSLLGYIKYTVDINKSLSIFNTLVTRIRGDDYDNECHLQIYPLTCLINNLNPPRAPDGQSLGDRRMRYG